MDNLNALLDEVSKLIATEGASITELRTHMVELDDWFHSDEFGGLPAMDRSRLQSVYQELRECIRTYENPGARAAAAEPAFETTLPKRQNGEASVPAAEVQ